jgi:adenosylcobinamide-GDP ribazoletransferase
MAAESDRTTKVPGWYYPALAIQFLTRLPIDLPGPINESHLVGSMGWYPLVGSLLGAFAAACATGLTLCLPAHISAMISLILLSVMTGNLHLDGLMDTADGFYGGHTVERRLEIMRDSRVGVHGVAAGVIALLMQWSLLWTLLEDQRLLWALPLALSAGRWSLVLAAKSQPPARQDGLGGMYATHLRPRHLLWATVAWIAVTSITVLVAATQGTSARPYVQGISAMATAAVVAAAFGRYARKKIGGLTGDTLGATSTIVELAVLLALVVGTR